MTAQDIPLDKIRAMVLIGATVLIHCHFAGGTDYCFITPRDMKQHVIKAPGFPKDGVPISGHTPMMFSVTQLPTQYTIGQERLGLVRSVMVDGKARKVKR